MTGGGARRLLALGLLAAAAGCGGSPPVQVGDTPRVQLFDTEPQMLTPWSDLLQVVPLARVPVDEGGWGLFPAGAGADAPGGGIRMAAGAGRMVLERPLDGSLAEARRVEVTVAGVEAGEVRLRWGRPGNDGDLGWARMSRLAEPAGRYRLDLDDQPTWQLADTLRLDVRSRRSSSPTVAELTAYGKQLAAEDGGDLGGVPLKLELGGEARNALAVPAGGEYRRRLAVRGPCRLRLGYGVPGAARRTVEVAIAVTPPAGALESALHDLVEPGDGRSGRWLDTTVDLAPFAGSTVELVVSATVDGPADPAAELLLLAEPEVVAPVAPAGPSLVLVSVDALRADALSLYGHPTPTSPQLDAWARRDGFVFRQVVAAAPWTLPAHMSMLTGLDAVRHGVNHDVGDGRRETSASPTASLRLLAEMLHDASFATAAITGGAYLDARYGFAQGFDRYASWPDRADDDGELAAGVDGALRWIGDHAGERFFLFLHSYAVHDPYRPWGGYLAQAAPGLGPVDAQVALVAAPNRAQDGFLQHNSWVLRDADGQRPLGGSPAELELVRGLYHAGVAHADAELGRLLDGLAALGVADHTLVVVTSDHGESLGEQGRVGHIDLGDEDLLVPLIMAAPGGRGAGGELGSQVRQVDIVPTMLELLGVPVPANLDGVSLAAVLDGAPSPAPELAFSYATAANRGLGLRDAGRLKYLLNTTAWRELAGREALYDLVADPAEAVDLAAADPRTPVLRERAAGYLHRAAVGLRLAVHNPGRGRLTARVEGDMVRPLGTSSLGRLDGPWVRCLEPGAASLEAPAGAAYTVLFEKVMGFGLHLGGTVETADGPVPLDWRVDVREVGDGRWLVLDGSQWREQQVAPAADAVSFGLTWLGPAAVRGASPAADDAALRDQLRALGYVE